MVRKLPEFVDPKLEEVGLVDQFLMLLAAERVALTHLAVVVEQFVVLDSVKRKKKQPALINKNLTLIVLTNPMTIDYFAICFLHSFILPFILFYSSFLCLFVLIQLAEIGNVFQYQMKKTYIARWNWWR